MKYIGITPVTECNGKSTKIEDPACWTRLEYPSSSKVRQYLNMAHKSVQREGCPPCIVGCSANSAMQIYVSAAAKQLNTKGIIYVPKRKVRSDATNYAIKMGSEVNEIKPGYLSVIRKAARQEAIDLKQYVEWDMKAAIKDTIDQCINIPENIKRIIVPTGSGLTAAGILIGVVRHKGPIKVVAIGTSPMADKAKILTLAAKMKVQLKIPPDLLEFIG